MWKGNLKVVWLVLCCAMCALPLSAQGTDEAGARAFAAEFLRGKGAVAKRSAGDLKLLHAAKGGYVFAPSGGEGFVWVSGSKDKNVVAGYSLTGGMRDGTLPTVLADMMDAVPEQRALQKEPERTEPIAPLLSSVWVQEEPFNGKCPYYRYANGTLSATRCLVGCVATAVSEAIRYYAFPEVLLDTLHGWQTEHYELTDVLPGTPIDWAHILDRYDGEYTDEEAEAIQDLSLYCGMACRMNYGVGVSGSNTYKLIEPLQRVFGYRYVNYYDRSMYSPGGWDGVLRHELRRGVPLVYSGFNFQFTGHAFIIDGMDEQGLYHVRWGESDGFYDGYFDIDLLEAYESRESTSEIGSRIGLFCNQSALAFHPEPFEAYAGDTLTYRAEDVTVDAVKFRRTPDTNGWVRAEVTMTNHSKDTIRYTLLAFVSDTQEVADWADVDDVGFTAVTLYPESSTEFSLFCDFKRSGLHYFGLTGDQEHMLYMEPLRVDEGGDYALKVGGGETLHAGTHDVTLRLCVENDSENGWCRDLLTYTLYPADGLHYRAHWRLLELAPGEAMADTVSFGCLEAGTEYILRVRCPWTVVYSYRFTTPKTDGIAYVAEDDEDECRVYSLQGMSMGRVKAKECNDLLGRLPAGMYIIVPRNGKPKKVFNY